MSARGGGHASDCDTDWPCECGGPAETEAWADSLSTALRERDEALGLLRDCETYIRLVSGKRVPILADNVRALLARAPRIETRECAACKHPPARASWLDSLGHTCGRQAEDPAPPGGAPQEALHRLCFGLWDAYPHLRDDRGAMETVRAYVATHDAGSAPRECACSCTCGKESLNAAWDKAPHSKWCDKAKCHLARPAAGPVRCGTCEAIAQGDHPVALHAPNCPRARGER